jgi:hypothetical protein
MTTHPTPEALADELATLTDLFRLDQDPESLYRRAEALMNTLSAELAAAKAERDSLRAEVERLRTGIIETARMVEDLKRPVHMDCPESPQAARNAHYMSVAYFARALAAPPVAEGV